MGAPRRFDHDEARRRHAAGEAASVLAKSYGVTVTAITRILKPERREAERESSRRFNERHARPCEVCGAKVHGSAWKGYTTTDGRIVCVQCRGKEKRERLRFDSSGTLTAVRCCMIECANGERWQNPDRFPNGLDLRDVRPGGIHGQCRSCQTRARREYRQRHREADAAYQRAYKRKKRASA